MSETKKYICKVEDLDKKLDSKMTKEFQSLFCTFDSNGKISLRNDITGLKKSGKTPYRIFNEYGIDFYHPTVRDAVAFDLVKIEDGSVSNDSEYLASEHIDYSVDEYERLLLNRNFRINLVDLVPEWSNITYSSGTTITKRTVDKMFQGVVFSETVLNYFSSIFDAYIGDDGKWRDDANIYIDKDIALPVTGQSDVEAEYSLVFNTFVLIPASVSRRYYDFKYDEYKELMQTKYNINNISTFALVDQSKGKTHTGKYLVKAQRKLQDGRYAYIVATIDKDGQFQMAFGKLDINVFVSDRNLILGVCEKDFEVPGNEELDESEWSNPSVGDISVQDSTTSSHYSVFEQRIPDYELKNVINYLQFKTREEGMNLCLRELARNIELKEIHLSECYVQETLAIWNLFKEFKNSNELLDLVLKFYEILKIYDQICANKNDIDDLILAKTSELDELMFEYNSLTNDRINEKISLGDKIHSIRLELDKNLKSQRDTLENSIVERETELESIIAQIGQIQSMMSKTFDDIDFSSEEWLKFKSKFDEVFVKMNTDSQNTLKSIVEENMSAIQNLSNQLNDTVQENHRILVEAQSEIQQLWEFGVQSIRSVLPMDSFQSRSSDIIDTTRMEELIVETFVWRNRIFNLGYELNQLKQMYTICSDNTIKVSRLVRNFKDMIERTENQVWDFNHCIKMSSLTSIATAGWEEIILLYDWHAVNAGEKTFSEMGFKSEGEYERFRNECFNIAYQFRNTEYANWLASNKMKLLDEIDELNFRISSNNDKLDYPEKYGWEAKEDEEDDSEVHALVSDTIDFSPFSAANKWLREWENVNRGLQWDSREIQTQDNANAYLNSVGDAKKVLDYRRKAFKQYKEDSKLMKERTINYLVKIGLIENEKGLEELATRSAAMHFEGDLDAELKKVECAKTELDDATKNMKRQRASLQTIIDNVSNLEQKSEELTNESKRLFNLCIGEKNRQIRNTLLTQKLENETKASEMKQLANKAKRQHLDDLSSLEKMRQEVDEKQKVYDEVVKTFKETIGLNEEMISQLAIKIYNQNQDEILQVN